MKVHSNLKAPPVSKSRSKFFGGTSSFFRIIQRQTARGISGSGQPVSQWSFADAYSYAAQDLRAVLQPNNAIGSSTTDLIDRFTKFTTKFSTLSWYISIHPKSISGKLNIVSHYHGYDDPKNTNFMNDDWHQAVGKYLGTSDPDKIFGVGGFYDRQANSINLPSDAVIGSATHEAMHRLSHDQIRKSLNDFINEGVTQYFTDCIYRELGVAPFTGHIYQAQLKVAVKLAAHVGKERLAKLYFSGDLTALKEIMGIIGTTPTRAVDAINAWTTAGAYPTCN